MAEIINVSTSLIGNLESKKTYQGISIYNLYKISKILNHFFDDLILSSKSKNGKYSPEEVINNDDLLKIALEYIEHHK